MTNKSSRLRRSRVRSRRKSLTIKRKSRIRSLDGKAIKGWTCQKMRTGVTCSATKPRIEVRGRPPRKVKSWSIVNYPSLAEYRKSTHYDPKRGI